MPAINPAAAIPDGKLARAIIEYIRDNETELFFSHSSRVYHFGALGRSQGPGAGQQKSAIHRTCIVPAGPSTMSWSSPARKVLSTGDGLSGR